MVLLAISTTLVFNLCTAAMIPTCDLTGDWQAVSGDKGAVYKFLQTTGLDDEDNFVVTYEPPQTAQVRLSRTDLRSADSINKTCRTNAIPG